MSSIKLSFMAGVLALSAVASPAAASDPSPPAPLPFDISFGTKIANEYNLRSVSQTRDRPALQGYVELTLKNGLYAGVWSSNVDFQGTDPYAEFDYYGGIRRTFDRLSLDAGYVYIDYLGENPGHELDFWKVYGIAKYAVSDDLTVGANVFWTSSFIGYNGIDGTHSSLFGRLALPDFGLPQGVGSYVSAELGKQWVSDDFAPDYVYWNAGFGLTYKAMTLDLRYTGADMSDSECAAFIGQRDSCGDRFLISLSFDTSLSKLP
ncbi:TorF family putative porin [Hyphomicrobium sp. CS1GBMeth3]|uniref:TorF family putative porin n=1 Tax=Hyphomicrobium sp. CS1GBMeth3 TaxID=1892845 RepID=UPI000931DAF6|nr:TorF family putative porin [Hyphomicrobium sp. CS1GBMeth3]